MSRYFLQLRDHGCQGAWEIFFRARELRQGSRPGDAGASVALAIAPENDASARNWRESVELAGCVLKDGAPVSSPGALQADIIVGVGLSCGELLAFADGERGPSLVNGGNETASPCRVLGDLLALVRHWGHDADKLDKIRLCWIGNAKGEYAGLADSWLESCLCFRHELFLSFPPGGEPHSEPLDFAMNAGGKIFLSHDPSLVVEGAHGVIAVPWLTGQPVPAPRHPLLADAELRGKARSELGEAPVFSFLPGAASSTWEEERRACLIACQAAVLEHMAALRKHNAA